MRIDDLILAQSIIQDGCGRSIIDACSGEGFVSLNLVKQCPDVQITAIDIDEQKCDILGRKIFVENLENRVNIICSDVLSSFLPQVDAVCCNPPLLPGESGFLITKNSRQIFFYQALLEQVCLCKCTNKIYLHIFNFCGIFKRTGKYPSLQSIANTYGFQVDQIYEGTREIGSKSAIRKKLPDLACFFPEGEIEHEGQSVKIKLLNNFNDTNLAVTHSIIKIYK